VEEECITVPKSKLLELKQSVDEYKALLKRLKEDLQKIRE
jgi:hypothetical protein